MIKPRSLLIAIVDDEECVRRALHRLMVSAGLAVASYPGGVEFLASLRVHRPDCVILDLHMPGMSGFDIQERLAQMGQRVPVVAITGHDAPGSESQAMLLGAAAYLRKPVDAKVLMAAISMAIEGSSTHGQGSP